MNAHEPISSGGPLDIPPIIDGKAFVDQVMAEITPPWKSRFGGRFVHDLTGQRPIRDWLLKGVFLARTFFLIVGEPGCGKSFVALDFAMTRGLAAVDDRAPREWFGRKFKPGATVYIAAEGQEDFIIRIHAWYRAKGLAPDTRVPVFLIPTAVDLRSSDADAKKLIEEIVGIEAICRAEFNCGVDLVVVDTFNRALAGGDDAKPDHVGSLIRNCGVIREATGAATGAVHHTPRGGDRARGHSSVTADNDGEVFVTPARDGAPNEWRVTRNKAGPRGDRHEFRLRSIEVGIDDDMDPVTSCYVVAGAQESSIEGVEMRDAQLAAQTKKPTMTADGRSILGPNLTVAMRSLHELIEREGEFPAPDVRAPHGRKVVTQKKWLDEIVRSMPGDDKADARFRDKCRKARDAAAIQLRNRGIIGMDGDFVWRTSKLVAMVDRPEGAPDPAAPLDGVDDGTIPF